MEILKIENIEYSYSTPGGKVPAVKNATAAFEKGKVYAITGSSGSGKTTLLSLMAGLDLPNRGEVIFNNKTLRSMNRNKYRRTDVGIIFQAFNLAKAADEVWGMKDGVLLPVRTAVNNK